MSQKSTVQDIVNSLIIDVDASASSNYPCSLDIVPKLAIKEIKELGVDHTDDLIAKIESLQSLHNSYCEAHDDCDRAQEGFMNSDEDDSEEMDSLYSEAMDNLSSARSKLEESVTCLRTILNSFSS